MNNIFAIATIEMIDSGYTFNEEFPIRESMSVNDIQSHIQSIIDKFNNILRPGESIRKLIRLVWYVPMLETRYWFDDIRMDPSIPVAPFTATPDGVVYDNNSWDPVTIL